MPTLVCPNCEEELTFLHYREQIQHRGSSLLSHAMGIAIITENTNDSRHGRESFRTYCPFCNERLDAENVEVRENLETSSGEEQARPRDTASSTMVQDHNDRAAALTREAAAKTLRCPGCRDTVDIASVPVDDKYFCTCGTDFNRHEALSVMDT